MVPIAPEGCTTCAVTPVGSPLTEMVTALEAPATDTARTVGVPACGASTTADPRVTVRVDGGSGTVPAPPHPLNAPMPAATSKKIAFAVRQRLDKFKLQ